MYLCSYCEWLNTVHSSYRTVSVVWGQQSPRNLSIRRTDPSGNIPCRTITLTLQCHLTSCSPEPNKWKSYPTRLQANTAMLTELKLTNDSKVAWRGNVRAASTQAESWNKQLAKNKPQRRQVCSNASHRFAIKAKMKTILQMQSIRNFDFDLINVISFNKNHKQSTHFTKKGDAVK